MSALSIVVAVALSPLFTQIAPHSVELNPARPAMLTARWIGKPVTVRIASVAMHGCGNAPWLYGVTANTDDRCSRLSQLSVILAGAPLIVPIQAFVGLGNIEHAEVRTTTKTLAVDLRGAEGGAEDYGVTLTFDRHGLIERRVYWPDGTAETTSFTTAH